MTTGSDRDRPVRAVLRALGPYADDVVLVGGWVPYLHLTYGRASAGTGHTSLTEETDIMIPGQLPRVQRRPVSDLLEEKGFRPIGDMRVLWSREAGRGETIEFLIPHRGPALSLGKPVPVDEQPGIQALSLAHLWILEAFTEELAIPGTEDGATTVVARIPTLAAFALNKANTFSLRGGEDSGVKAGKDLLYLRDIMASGRSAVDVVEADLDRMCESEHRDRIREYSRRAVVHLELAAPGFHPRTAAILSERESMTLPDARADVEGHLKDFERVLEERLG